MVVVVDIVSQGGTIYVVVVDIVSKGGTKCAVVVVRLIPSIVARR